MKKIKLVLMTAVAAMLMSACGTTSTVPITGRKHTLLVSDAQILSLSKAQYSEILEKSTLSSNTANTAMVNRVGRRLASAVENYLRSNGAANELQNFAWEFNLIRSNEANAFCMPGGKIAVYEGILPYTQNENALAIVLGHEIAHAVAKHSAEQISKQIRQSYGTQILGTVLNSAVGSGVGDLAALAAQQGFSFANLKYSRDNETEADYIGLILAAMAGYDPQEAIAFWQRMSSGKRQQSDFLSSHPSDSKRIAMLKRQMPEAMKYYKGAKPKTTATWRFTPTKRK
ncbi:M48 family metallopeptidase [Hallella bergensis]|uniref:M48 family metallopeptidase n=1 Tax=Hallella bergensis TaxID=242750 RepID=UPI0039908D11